MSYWVIGLISITYVLGTILLFIVIKSFRIKDGREYFDVLKDIKHE